MCNILPCGQLIFHLQFNRRLELAVSRLRWNWGGQGSRRRSAFGGTRLVSWPLWNQMPLSFFEQSQFWIILFTYSSIYLNKYLGISVMCQTLDKQRYIQWLFHLVVQAATKCHRLCVLRKRNPHLSILAWSCSSEWTFFSGLQIAVSCICSHDHFFVHTWWGESVSQREPERARDGGSTKTISYSNTNPICGFHSNDLI